VLELSGICSNAVEAISFLKDNAVDLLFLDIQMPHLLGTNFLRTLKNAPKVIFTTAYRKYALEGFDVNALDYLVKPISFERFLKAALKAKEYYEIRKENEAKSTGDEEYFFVKADNKLVKIFFNEILFVEALQNYVTIHTATKKYITYLTFKSVEEYLPKEAFIKTHKSYIVSAAKIDSIEGNDIRIKEYHVPISRNEKDLVMERLLKGKFLKRE